MLRVGMHNVYNWKYIPKEKVYSGCAFERYLYVLFNMNWWIMFELKNYNKYFIDM